MMTPLFCIKVVIWVVLEPGAADMSRIHSPGWGSKTSGGSMEAISCTYI